MSSVNKAYEPDGGKWRKVIFFFILRSVRDVVGESSREHHTPAGRVSEESPANGGTHVAFLRDGCS